MKDTDHTSLRDLLDPDARRSLMARGQPQHFPPGATIFAEGEPGSALLVIDTGQIEVSTVTRVGRKLVLAYLGPDDIVGEVAVLDEGPRSATASAISDVTGRMVGLRDFRAFLIDFPEVHLALTVELCRKLRTANARLEDRTEKAGDARLARAVLRLADKFGTPRPGAIEIPIALSQSDLGDLSGLTRANVNRYIRAWADAGWVSFDKRTLCILDQDALEDLAEA
ncbi:MAG: Crp/Fnr family transcriptional regulator [Pseudomonadota bacterium]